MTPIEKLQRVVELASKAADGPWFWEHDENEGYKIYMVKPDGTALYLMQFSFDEASTKFTTDARTSAPSMARALLVLLPALERLKNAEAASYDVTSKGLHASMREYDGAVGEVLAAYSTAKKELSGE